MRRGHAVAQVLAFLAVTLLEIALSPVILLAGEPLRRYYLRRLRRAPSRPRHGLASAVIATPVFVALTAPARWVIDRVRRVRLAGFGDRGNPWPPPAGVREPRRPKPSPPAGAIALAEPRQQTTLRRTLKSLPATVSGQARRLRSWLGGQTTMLRARASRLVRGWAG